MLITGENGTGKELVARAVHRRSAPAARGLRQRGHRRPERVAVRERAVRPRQGSVHRRPGRSRRAGFELASGGTLLLDEIGNLPLRPAGQAADRAARAGRSIRVGSGAPRDIDIRLICATNLALPRDGRRGEFREDLLYRINTIEIPLPPLRERREDIPLLAHHFLARYARKYRKDAERHQLAGAEQAEGATTGRATSASCSTRSSGP